MKHFKFTMLGTIVVLGFSAPSAMALERSYNPYNNTSTVNTGRSVAVQNFLNYEDREPCQNYRMPPTGFYYKGCDLVRRTQVVAKAEPTAKSIAKIEPAAGSEMVVYKVNFDYDRSSIDPSEKAMLDQIAYDIKKYNPREITVAGYTDTAGPMNYNQKLSERRSTSVSQTLNNRGVSSYIIGREAYGESNLAVETRDSVALRENRRAVITFMK